MDDLPGHPQTKLHLPNSGEGLLLWVAVGIAAVFFAFLIFDLVVNWRRKRYFQKRLDQARAKRPAVSAEP